MQISDELQARIDALQRENEDLIRAMDKQKELAAKLDENHRLQLEASIGGIDLSQRYRRAPEYKAPAYQYVRFCRHGRRLEIQH